MSKRQKMLMEIRRIENICQKLISKDQHGKHHVDLFAALCQKRIKLQKATKTWKAYN